MIENFKKSLSVLDFVADSDGWSEEELIKNATELKLQLKKGNYIQTYTM